LHKQFKKVLFDEQGRAYGIEIQADEEDGGGVQAAKAPLLIGDPSYFPAEKLQVTGKVIRSICILDHPIKDTDAVDSTQIIIPAEQLEGKSNDVYVLMVSDAHCVAAKKKYVAIISTTVETSDPQKEIEVAIRLISPVLERFDKVSECYEPKSDGINDNCYITKSYDATSHFETTSNDVLDLHKRVFGTHLDMTINADSTEADY